MVIGSHEAIAFRDKALHGVVPYFGHGVTTWVSRSLLVHDYRATDGESSRNGRQTQYRKRV